MNNKLVTRAYQLNSKLLEMKKMVETSGLVMGRILHVIQEQELYTELGYDTFEQYLANPDLAFKRSTAYNLKKIYKQWVLDYGYTEEELGNIGYERLLEAGKVATADTKELWIEKAKSLSRGDLMASVRESQEESVHADFVPYPTMRRCSICGKWYSTDTDWLCNGSGVH